MTTDDLVREGTVNPSLDDALELAAALQANLNAVVLGTPGAVSRRRPRCWQRDTS